jgi:hypothetical protein
VSFKEEIPKKKYRIMKYDAVYIGTQALKFWRNLPPPYSG